MKEYDLKDNTIDNGLTTQPTGFGKLKNFFRLELTPKQEKVLGEVHDFLFQEIEFSELRDFMYQEVDFASVKKFWCQDIDFGAVKDFWTQDIKF